MIGLFVRYLPVGRSIRHSVSQSLRWRHSGSKVVKVCNAIQSI